MKAFEADHLELDDELDHLGLYLKHNHYSTRGRELAGNNARVHFVGYRSEIDKYFRAKLLGDGGDKLLTQRMPAQLREVLRFLAASDKPGRSKVASYLLDVSGEWRRRIWDGIEPGFPFWPWHGESIHPRCPEDHVFPR